MDLVKATLWELERLANAVERADCDLAAVIRALARSWQLETAPGADA